MGAALGFVGLTSASPLRLSQQLRRLRFSGLILGTFSILFMPCRQRRAPWITETGKSLDWGKYADDAMSRGLASLSTNKRWHSNSDMYHIPCEANVISLIQSQQVQTHKIVRSHACKVQGRVPAQPRLARCSSCRCSAVFLARSKDASRSTFADMSSSTSCSWPGKWSYSQNCTVNLQATHVDAQKRRHTIT